MTTYNNDRPREPEIIKQELRELELSMTSSKEWLLANSDDKLIQNLITQDEYRKEQLHFELEESYRYYHYHFLKYAIKTEDSVEISSLNNLLSAFKGVLNTTLEHLRGKNKNLNLYFDAVYQGSFGILLSTDQDDFLLAGEIEETFSSFFDSIEKLNTYQLNADVLNIFDKNKPLMRKYRTFYRSITTAESPVEISWGSHLSKSSNKYEINNIKAKNMYKILGDADHPETQEIIESGTIQGISLIDKTLQFVPSKKEGTKIKLDFSKEFCNQIKSLLGESAKIKYKIVTAYDEVKDRIITTKSLLEFEKI